MWIYLHHRQHESAWKSVICVLIFVLIIVALLNEAKPFITTFFVRDRKPRQGRLALSRSHFPEVCFDWFTGCASFFHWCLKASSSTRLSNMDMENQPYLQLMFLSKQINSQYPRSIYQMVQVKSLPLSRPCPRRWRAKFCTGPHFDKPGPEFRNSWIKQLDSYRKSDEKNVKRSDDCYDSLRDGPNHKGWSHLRRAVAGCYDDTHRKSE